MTTDNQTQMLLSLPSGKRLVVSRVMLFPEPELQQVFALKAKAHEKLAGFSTGLGFWGSPGWVIGGATLLGLAESFISNSKMKEGIEFLKQAVVKQEQLNTRGRYFAISEIAGIHRPNPATWKANQVADFQVDLNPLGFIEKGQAVQQYNISRKQISDGIASVTAPIGFIHNDDEFVWVEVEGQSMAVRWASVDCYQISSWKET